MTRNAIANLALNEISSLRAVSVMKVTCVICRQRDAYLALAYRTRTAEAIAQASPSGMIWVYACKSSVGAFGWCLCVHCRLG